jgi:hypothetical protein
VSLIHIIQDGSDFAKSNASRALGNIAQNSMYTKSSVYACKDVLQALVRVAYSPQEILAGNDQVLAAGRHVVLAGKDSSLAGKDKSRGNAAMALGNLCDEDDARTDEVYMSAFTCIYVCMHVCMHVCICNVFMCVCVYGAGESV